VLKLTLRIPSAGTPAGPFAVWMRMRMWMSIKIVANSSVTQTTLHCFVGRPQNHRPQKRGVCHSGRQMLQQQHQVAFAWMCICNCGLAGGSRYLPLSLCALSLALALPVCRPSIIQAFSHSKRRFAVTMRGQSASDMSDDDCGWRCSTLGDGASKKVITIR